MDVGQPAILDARYSDLLKAMLLARTGATVVGADQALQEMVQDLAKQCWDCMSDEQRQDITVWAENTFGADTTLH